MEQQDKIATETDEQAFFRRLRCLPFVSVHLGCLLALWTGVGALAAWTALALYVIRAFGLTAGYHRYFSHKTFKTSRAFQFVLGLIGASAAQMGPLWWAAHHRTHHGRSDREGDIHSPVIHGFWWSHVGWIMSGRYRHTEFNRVKDWTKYPELVWLDRHHYIVSLGLAATLFLVGLGLQLFAPSANTTGLQMLAWGYFISTVALYHTTFSINSISHLLGSRRYDTVDRSRNNAVLALLTLGEGWHNNHHRYPGSERQGFTWYELDITHAILVFLSWFRIVWKLKGPPADAMAKARAA